VIKQITEAENNDNK